jgi:hypothetical protein
MNHIFYTGVCENRHDPLRLGRCQVRVFGLHSSDKADLPTEDLPWAYPILPITSAGMSGIGHAPVGPVEGTWLLIIFRDADNQQPLMLGSMGGVPGGESEGGFFSELGASIGLGGGIEDRPETGTGKPAKDVIPPPPVNPSGIIGPLAILIAKAESGAAGYNAYNKGTSGGKIISGSGPRNLVSMTLAEIQADQSLPQSDPNCLRAVGKYQCVRKTLAGAIDSLKFDLDRKFDQLTQDIICQEYLVCRKRPALLQYYNNPDKNNETLLKKAGQDLAAEFASIEDPFYPGYTYKGPTYYYWKSGNRVGTKWASQVRPTLIAEWEFRNSGK